MEGMESEEWSVCVSECSLLSCERLYSVVPLRVSLFVPCAGKKI